MSIITLEKPPVEEEEYLPPIGFPKFTKLELTGKAITAEAKAILSGLPIYNLKPPVPAEAWQHTMRGEIRTLWMEGLRSRLYPQGIERLRDDAGRFCALGVLMELAVQAGVISRLGNAYRYRHTYAETQLLPEVVEWAGITGIRPVDPIIAMRGKAFGDGMTCDCCSAITVIYANDHMHWPFSRIADVIEANVLVS